MGSHNFLTEREGMIENLKCPDCGGRMKSRTNSKDGTKFWGCAGYPDCWGTRDNMGRSAADRRAEIEEGERGEADNRYIPGQHKRSRRYD